MAKYIEVFDFEEEGIFTTATTVKDDTVRFRLSAKAKEDFEGWKTLYTERST